MSKKEVKTTMLTWTCDRCGLSRSNSSLSTDCYTLPTGWRVLKTDEINPSKYVTDPLLGSAYPPAYKFPIPSKQYDLCMHCFDTFREFLGSAKP